LALADGFSAAGSAEISALIGRLEALEEVDFAEYDLKWLERLQAMLNLAQSVIRVLTVVFGMAVIFVVGNTIRLDIQNRIEEIEVMALVGATESFVRRPFLYAGLWYGLLGGLLALLVLLTALSYLEGPLQDLLSAYQGSFQVQSLSLRDMLWILAGSGVLGLLGASLAVRRHLRALTPKTV
jgi:cell division transport system permease protein